MKTKNPTNLIEPVFDGFKSKYFGLDGSKV